RGVHSVAAERHRLLSAPPEPQRPGRDPDELDREATALREQEAALGGQLSAARGQLAAAVSGRTEAEAALSALDRQLAQAARVAEQRKAEHQASGARAALRARAETLSEAVKRGADATGLLLSGESRFSGVVGAFAALLTVEDGAGEAIATALGAAAGAVAVS